MNLHRSMGFAAVFSIAAGAMISSGIFILPGLAFSLSGPSVFVAYLLAGVLGFVGVLSVLELSTAMPRAGGDYFYITRSLGPFAGTLSGFISWFALSLKTAFAIWGMSAVTLALVNIAVDAPEYLIWLQWLSAGWVVFFVGLNLLGVKEAATFEIILVAALISLMTLFIVAGLPKVRIGAFDPFIRVYDTTTEALSFSGGSINDILSTAAFVFISFGGLLKAASIGEEVRNPSRNLPLGLMSALVVVTILYMMLVLVTVGVLSPDKLIRSNTPMADAARVLLGAPGYYIISIAAFLAFITTANAGIMAASRYPLALARDGLGPSILSRVTRGGTPWISIVVTGGFILVALLLPLKVLVKVASTIILISYVLSAASVIILRESHIQNYRPTFRTPFYPWLQIVSILIFSAMVVDMSIASLKISLAWLYISIILTVSSVVFYLLYGRKSGRESALLHLINRFRDRRLEGRKLEDELKGIIRNRDNVVHDDFDELMENALVMDVPAFENTNSFFAYLAPRISGCCGLAPETVLQLLREREEQASTAISTFVAIPHILIRQDNVFEIVLVRSQEGITFNPDFPAVKAVFIILGSMNKRNLHLRSLASIAQIIQNPSFKKQWVSAKDPQQLRDILLLGTRRRNTK